MPETITNGIILNNLSVENVYNSIKKLIKNSSYRKSLQKKSVENFYLTNKNASNLIDAYRDEILENKLANKNLKKLKILHVTNFNERHNGRLF